MQVIRDTTAGSRLGEAFGTGLQELAQNKLAMIQQQYNQAYNQNQYAQGVGKLFEKFGVPPDKALEMGRSMYMLTPQERALFWQNPAAWLGQQEQPQAGIGALQQAGQMPGGLSALQQPQELQEPESIVGPYTPYNPNIQGPQGVAAQQAQVMPQIQQPDRAKQLQEAFMTPSQRAKQETLQLARQKENRAQQQTLQPFITKVTERAERWKNIRGKAEKALELLQKAHDKFPGWFTGNLPENVQPWLIRDPDVRDYQSLVLEMIPMIAAEGDDKRLTNLKLQLTKAAKPNVSQPIKTQMDVLEGIIDLSNEKKDINNFLLAQEDKATGFYPNDLRSRVSEFSAAQEDPLKYPRYFKHNTIIEDHGKLFMNVNGKRWQQLKR